MDWSGILRKAVREGVKAAARAVRTSTKRSTRASGRGLDHSSSSAGPASAGPASARQASTRAPDIRAAGQYPGDFAGRATIVYDPKPDGRPDPGEIVWAWVPFEEDYSRGKDRPVLAIGYDSSWLLALMLTSRDHDLDKRQEAASGRYWFDIGIGDWDPQRRPSEVRVDRIVRLDPAVVRREGGKLERQRFDQVAAEVRRVNRW